MGINLSSIAIDPKVVEKISGIVVKKGTPIIFSQNPPPGTPIPQGMQVQVVTFQPGDISVGVLDDRAHIAVRDVPYEELIKLYSADDFFGTLKGKDTLPPEKREQFVNEINAKLRGKGLSGEVSINDADAVFDSIKGAGSIGVNRPATVDVGGFGGRVVTRDIGGVTRDIGGVTRDVGGVTRDVGGIGGIGDITGGIGR
jgi:hypothetical protein